MSKYTEVETLKSKLVSERAKLVHAVGQLSAEELVRPFPGGWSAKDIIAHLAVAEAVNVKFARLMLSLERPVQLRELAQDFPDYDVERRAFTLDQFNAYIAEKWRAKSMDETMGAFHDVRAETLAWLESLTPGELERGGQHAVWGDQTVRGMLKILVIHDKFHTQDMLKRQSPQE